MCAGPPTGYMAGFVFYRSVANPSSFLFFWESSD